MTDFLPCPFCGSDNIGIRAENIDDIGNVFTINAYCKNCEASGKKITIKPVKEADVINTALQSWNERN